MTADFHGAPCWYELSTSDITRAQAFYTAILGWTVADSGMPGMDYRLGKVGDTMVAGLTPAQDGMPSAWTLYFAVTDCDASFAQAQGLAATPVVPPTDIPGTGRFAIMIDPQGAAFGILQPEPMEDGSAGGAWDPDKTGHGNWHDLVTADPAAALAFYGALFGWTSTRSMPMGADMTYHFIGWNGRDIGGAFAPSPPSPAYWKPYFAVASANGSIPVIASAGGTLLSGPDEVPGDAFILQVKDPQGAVLGLVGPK
jgi:predicted enzyme related to lactoylglutathione lyase